MRAKERTALVTVADIIALPAFENVQPVACCEGAQLREVRNVGIVDCPPDYNEYSVYLPGEFILTNLGFAFGNPDLAEKSLITLIRRDVAAIAIKTVYQAPISSAVRQESARRGVPLYTHEGAYYETVAYQSLGLIERDKREYDRGKLIDEVLCTHDADFVRRKLSVLAGAGGSRLQCLAFRLAAGDPCSFYATMDGVSSALAAARAQQDQIEALSVSGYRDRILAFVSYGSGSPEELERAGNRLAVLAGLAGRLHCGASLVLALSDGDLAVRQALAAADEAWRRGLQLVCWPALQAGAFVQAVREDRLFMSASELYRRMLADHDRDHGGDLLRTAEAYVSFHGNIKAVAEELHQHPNTVRYRMRKMQSVLGLADQKGALLMDILYLAFLPLSEA